MFHDPNNDYHIENSLILNNRHLYNHENIDIYHRDKFRDGYSSYLDMKLKQKFNVEFRKRQKQISFYFVHKIFLDNHFDKHIFPIDTFHDYYN